MKKHYVVYLIVTAIAIVTFLYLYGWNVLNPCYVAWLEGGGDLSQHYMGWKFYRNSDWFFPFGHMNTCLYPEKVSIIFTDSIPLFAVIFKLLSPMLPNTFQYFGFWGISCFILQGLISANILRKYVKNDFAVIVGSCFFILSPIMIRRMYAHTALAGQWLILLGLWCMVYQEECFAKNLKAVFAWGGIGVLCSGVHIYYVVMLGVVLVGFVFADYVRHKNITRVLAPLGGYLLGALGTIYMLGGFSSSSSSFGAGGLGCIALILMVSSIRWGGPKSYLLCRFI